MIEYDIYQNYYREIKNQRQISIKTNKKNKQIIKIIKGKL